MKQKIGNQMSRKIAITNLVSFDNSMRKEIRKWLLTNMPSDKNNRFKFIADGIIFKDEADEFIFKLTFITQSSKLIETLDMVNLHLFDIAIQRLYSEYFEE
jgi:hypothetical protein